MARSARRAQKPRESRKRPRQNWPNYIRAWRDERNLSQEEVGARAGITGSMVSIMEREMAGFTIEKLRLVANVLNVRAGWLLDRNPHDPDDVWSIAEELRTIPTAIRRRVIDAAKLVAGL